MTREAPADASSARRRPSPAGPAPDDGAGVRLPPSLPLLARAADAALQRPPDRVRVPRPPRAGRRVPVPTASIDDDVDVVTCHPDHVRSLFTAKPEEAPSLTGRVAAAADRRPQLGAHRGRAAPHAPAQAAAAAVPRRGRAALHGDDRRGGRPRDRPLADRHAVRARAAHAGDHPRRDHGRDLRHRGHARQGHARARPARRRSGARSPCPRDPRHSWSSCSTWAATSRSARPALFLRLPRPPPVRGDRGAPRGRSRRAAPTSSRCCSTPRPRTASASPTRSCATSCSRSCSPATRRPPTRWPGRSSACCATRPPTTGCATSPAPTTIPTATSRRPSTRRCAPAR